MMPMMRMMPAAEPIADSLTARVMRLNEAYIRAAVAGDVAWYDAHLAEDFVCIDSDGSVLDRKAFLRQQAQESELATYRLTEVNLRQYGDVFLVRATGDWTSKTGKPGVSRYLDVWVHRAGELRCVSAQITRPAAAPGSELKL